MELCDILHISKVIAEGRPMQVSLDCRDRGGSSATAEGLLQDLGLFLKNLGQLQLAST